MRRLKADVIDIDKQKEIVLISKLTELEKFCLDAYLINGDKRSTYIYSRIKQPNATDESIRAATNRFFNEQKTRAYLESRKKQLAASKRKNEMGEECGDVTQIDKTELLRELTTLFHYETDTKTKADLGMKIADLQQMKKEQIEKEEQIKSYLPLKCSKCELYINAKMSLNE